MKSLVIFYSFSGKTALEAKKIAEKTGADLFEVKEEKKRGILSSFFKGCPQAMKRKSIPVKKLNVNLDEYEKIIVGAPIWAGFPAPAFNSIVNALPKDKEVELFFTSGSGNSAKSKEGTEKLIESKKCVLIDYRDVETG